MTGPKKFTVLASIAMLTFSAVWQVADAQDLELRVGPSRYDRDSYYTQNDRRYRQGPGCNPYTALRIARSRGLRGAEIVAQSRQDLVVEGFTRNGPFRFVFINSVACKIRRSYSL